ncbi:MAG: MFS transporter [Microthrixaceae bacterium]
MEPHGAPPARLWDPEHRLLLVGIVCLVTVVAVESMAISTVMPIVEADLGDLWLYGWVFSAFYLGTLIGVVLGGRAVDRVRPVGPMAIGVAVFMAGLAVGGLAPNMVVLVLGRFLQGLGAGVVPAVAYVCVGRGFPAELRPRVFAVMSTAWVVPSLVSPLLASEVAERVGWRWVFLGLMPVVLAVAAMGVPAVATVDTPPTDGERSRTPFGSVAMIALGAALVLGGLGSVAVALGVAVATVGIGIGLPAFRRLTPPGTLRAVPALPAAVLTRGVLTYAFFSADAFVSLAMTSVRDTTTRAAGLVLAASSLAWTLGSWTQARFHQRWGAPRLVRLGGASIIVGVSLMAVSLSSGVPVGLWFVAGAFAGLGMGTAYAPLSTVTLAEAAEGQVGAATSALQMTDILGIALGTGLAGVVVTVGDRLGLADRPVLVVVFALAGIAGAGVMLLAPRLAHPLGVSSRLG